VHLPSAIILIPTAAILSIIALLAVSYFRRRCPRCGRGGLKLAGGYEWAGRDERGYRTGGKYVFYSCSLCSARLRWDLRQWSDASDGEWKKHAKIGV